MNTRYLINRLIWLPIVLWATATLTFIALRLVPGNPIQSVAAQMLDAQSMERALSEWGLDRPILEQYTAFIGHLLRGDLGVSMSSGVPLSRLLYEKMPPTIELALVAMLISTLIGVVAGVISAVTRRRWLDYSVRTFAVLGVSIPWFWIAIVMIVIFSVNLGWTPVSGRIKAGMPYETITNFMIIDTIITGNWAALGSFLQHLTLPALAIGLTSAGFVARLTRSAMLDVLRVDFVRTARAKGLQERRVVYWHALRNAIIPVITLQGLQFGALLGGAVVTERVFSWPGVGRMLLDGILRRDYPVVQGTIIVVAFIYVLMNLLVDLLYPLVDPRLRYK
jgi:peptide/nickel transport system permease protein